jgi:hypothetical protein
MFLIIFLFASSRMLCLIILLVVRRTGAVGRRGRAVSWKMLANKPVMRESRRGRLENRPGMSASKQAMWGSRPGRLENRLVTLGCRQAEVGRVGRGCRRVRRRGRRVGW